MVLPDQLVDWRASDYSAEHFRAQPFIAVSYHAPPGVNWGIFKSRQAHAFASWLSTQNDILPLVGMPQLGTLVTLLLTQ
jgi:hypothetical protein